MSRVICQESHFESDMASGLRLSTFYHPSMRPLFHVLTLLGVSSQTFMLSENKLVHSNIELLGTTHISVSVSQGGSLRFGLSNYPSPLLYV